MKIAIAARGLYGLYNGPNTYTLGLSKALAEVCQKHEIHLYYNHPLCIGTQQNAIEHCIQAPNRFLWDHVFLPRELRKDGIDFVIFPKGTISFSLPCAAAVIILDLGYFYPELNAYKTLETFYMRLAMRYASQYSKIIFAISEYTRQDVIRLLKVSQEKVFNILGGIQPNRFQYDRASLEFIRGKYHLIEPFIFYPTNVSPRKNFIRLLGAFEQIEKEIPHHLYFTGGLSWKSENVFERIQKSFSHRVHQLGSVPVNEMGALYKLSQFSIYPSLFEGFGLPILESFQYGSPLLISNCTSLPEIAGNAALVVNAYDSTSIASGMRILAQNADVRELYRQRGFERLKDFSWEKTAAKVLSTIENYSISTMS